MTREQFWTKVQYSGGCWEWQGKRTPAGYGHVVEGRRIIGAHRWAYADRRGIIPPGLLVLHRCDNPPCVRPDHLWVGTQRDNIQDMIRKGRAPDRRQTRHRGARHRYAKLTPALTERIRRRWRERQMSMQALGAEVGLSKTTVRRVLLRRTWVDRDLSASALSR